jgi:predicted GIY-YIG superfamily endonuclease
MNYIYLIENEISDSKVYKIGYTNNLKKRLTELNTGNPGKLSLLKYFETKIPTKLEKVLHNRYKSKKIKGEWFELDDTDISSFNEICRKYENNLTDLIEMGNLFI